MGKQNSRPIKAGILQSVICDLFYGRFFTRFPVVNPL